MIKKGMKVGSMLLIILMIPFGLMGAQIKGKIQSIVKKSSTIQMLNLKTKKVEVIQFGKQTKYVNAKSIKDFILKDVILVDVEKGKEATKIKRVLVELPAKMIADTKLIHSLVNGDPGKYMLLDARPAGSYNAGHLPFAVSFPVTDFKKKVSLLPVDKDRLLVFYCGGPT
ncbi:MAG: rhodanese-like domain-containing protein [SAR324 cluster bacterium]|nr:rhodanese-like domain-containing protein [SAR324 cluster bacterium]MBL7034840.1 rhodanese-like domain-containing protein [SAR324 cluster bacterium]